MAKQPDIDDVLAFVQRDPKNTTDFLLGTICSDLKTIKERQVVIDKKIDDNKTSLEKKINDVQLEVDKIKKENAFKKGFIAAVTVIGGTIGAAVATLGKFIYTTLFLAH